MTTAYRTWTGPAREMALAVDDAVTAAQAGDAGAFAAAATQLRRLDREQLTVLLGTITQDLLERAHPDGLDSDDAEQALQSCIRASAGWYDRLDSDALIRALTGVLGVDVDEDMPNSDALQVLLHGLLLIADQLRGAALDLPPFLDAALRELMRAQTVELP